MKKYEASPTHTATKNAILRQMTPKRFLHLTHRFLIFLVAVGYVGTSFGATNTAMHLLRGHDNPWNEPEDDTLPLIAGYLGLARLRDSPLVKTYLHDSTAPLNTAIYLQDNSNVRFMNCENAMAPSVAKVFSNAFMRTMYDAITSGVSYNITEIAPSAIELIAPIVDCQASLFEVNDPSSAKFFYLVRDRSDPDNVSVLIAYVSNQQFKSTAQSGAAAVATILIVNDMRATDLETRAHTIVSLGYPYWNLQFRKYEFQRLTTDGRAILQLVLPPGKHMFRKTIETACREGFYIKGESEQSNINNYQWVVGGDAVTAVSRWRWVSKPVLHDSWAWIHAVQFFIGMSLLSNLTILCIAAFRSFRSGHRWIGDAFVSISASQAVTAPAVLASWYINEFWCIREFAYSTAFKLTGTNSLLAYDWHMRADCFTLYLGACGLIGHVCRERIDPVLATVLFLVGYDCRVGILKHVFPSVAANVAAYAEYTYSLNVSPRLPDQDKISPMGFWTTHLMGKPKVAFLARVFLPIYSTLVIVVLYALARRVYRHVYPTAVRVQMGTANSTTTSEHDESLIAQKRILTQFEVATGAKLENRYGVLSEIEASVFVAGTKLASSDGIYSTGFVIANHKFLVQTSDYWSIVLMKVLGRRFRNVYVYDVSGTTVQQTARLVYPHTLSVADLMRIDVSRLS
jgi:hypothetical protein